MTIDDRSLPLARFTVLDLTRVRAGPTCVRQLADWGANVLKVELPESVEGNAALGGPRHGSDFQNLHRNKRSLTLNLKEPDGLDVFKRLVANADVKKVTVWVDGDVVLETCAAIMATIVSDVGCISSGKQ